MDIHIKRLEVEKEQNWVTEAETIPSFKFPPEWQIQVIPPYADAVIRFKVILPSGLEKSVFLDSRCSLDAYFNEAGKSVPYWEVSPVAGYWGRCEKNNIDALMEMIACEDKE